MRIVGGSPTFRLIITLLGDSMGTRCCAPVRLLTLDLVMSLTTAETIADKLSVFKIKGVFLPHGGVRVTPNVCSLVYLVDITSASVK